jgi:hypothetical protein
MYRKNVTVARTILSAEFEFYRLIPHQVEHLLHPDMAIGKRYYWWRAISAAYLIRPNQRTQDYLQTLSTPGLHRLNGSCVSMYVRHGDKGREMKLQSFSAFANTAKILSSQSLAKRNVIFFGTETAQVVLDAEAWVNEHRDWKILYNPLQLEIFNHSNTRTHTHSSRSHHHKHHKYIHNQYRRLDSNSNSSSSGNSRQLISRSPHIRSEYEFLSMIINLADLMKCNAYVCTLMSNYCRLLDEFRAVVAAKPHALFADLSPETCAKPPCVGPDHIKSFDW